MSTEGKSVELPKPEEWYTVRFFFNEDSEDWTAQCIEIPGCITQGKGISETTTRMREAIQSWFDLEQPYAGVLLMKV